ncbi:MAG: hypothetical protein OXC53_09410 [Rhodobacteraceae bacterium]|nr:hypothetical protein [Paracoccaceae bacterium]
MFLSGPECRNTPAAPAQVTGELIILAANGLDKNRKLKDNAPRLEATSIQ